MSAFRFSIITPDKKQYEGAALSVTVSGENGRLTVLARHTPMLAVLVQGHITIRTEKELLTGQTGPGILRVDRDETVALVHSFQWDGDESEVEVSASAVREDGLLL